MQRPTGITASAALLYALLALGTVVALSHGAQHGSPNAKFTAEQLRHFAQIVEVVSCTCAAVIYWFYFKGQDWARWLVIIGSVLQIATLRWVAQIWQQTGALERTQIVINTAFDLFLLVYLNTPGVRAWFYASRLRWRNRSSEPLT